MVQFSGRVEISNAVSKGKLEQWDTGDIVIADSRPVVWVRPSSTNSEFPWLNASGLSDLIAGEGYDGYHPDAAAIIKSALENYYGDVEDFSYIDYLKGKYRRLVMEPIDPKTINHFGVF